MDSEDDEMRYYVARWFVFIRNRNGLFGSLEVPWRDRNAMPLGTESLQNGRGEPCIPYKESVVFAVWIIDIISCSSGSQAPLLVSTVGSFSEIRGSQVGKRSQIPSLMRPEVRNGHLGMGRIDLKRTVLEFVGECCFQQMLGL